MNAGTRSWFAAVKHWNPKVQALIDWDESAATRRSGQVGSGPLSGWPVAVKDIIDVAGFPTRCNADFVPAKPACCSAAVVDALLAKGAFVAAKAVTTTFAYFDPGPTRNPWNLAHTPGGSSSGSAAAVACGMVRLALGTQTVGSVNRPASFCGVVGFKPTIARLSTAGVFPLSPTVDTVGLFAGNVGDIQTAFAAVTDDPVLSKSGPLRIGVTTDLRCPAANPEMTDAVRSAADQLKNAGHDVLPVVIPEQVSEAYELHQTLIAAEAAQSHRQLFADYGRYYPAKMRDLLIRGSGVSESELDEVRSRQRHTTGMIDGLSQDYDALLVPSAPGSAPFGLESTGDPRMSLLWTHTGTPSLTLPVALSRDGLPLGVQLVGSRMDDQALLAAGAVAERVLRFSGRPQGIGALS